MPTGARSFSGSNLKAAGLMSLPMAIALSGPATSV
jgi:hypothetical protein